MANSDKKWNKFQRLSVKPGRFSERAKRMESATLKHAHKFIVERAQSAREARRHIAFWLLAMGGLIGLATVQFFLFQASYTTVASGTGGTYAEALQGDINTLNPLYATTEGERAASRLLFSSLLTHDQTGRLRGDLAQNYSVLDEGKRYRVTLRPVVLWHDNKPLTADDVVFTANLLKNPAADIPLGASWRNIKVQKIDNRTVDFVLETAYAPFAHALTFPVVPKHILSGVQPTNLRDARFATQPVGSGPFSFRLKQQVQAGQDRTVIHMIKNPNYYAATVAPDRFQLHTYKTKSELAQALRSHAVNAASGVSLDDYKQFAGDTDYVADLVPVNAGVFALFNTTGSSALKDVRVRQALQVGTDVRKAVDELGVKTSVLDTPILASQVALDGVYKAPFDGKRATELLDEAGWKLTGKERSKEGEKLTLRMVSVKNSDHEKVVESLAKQWRALGVAVEVRLVDVSDPTQNLVNSVLQPRDFDVLVHELNLGADPDVYAYWHSSQAVQKGLNFSNYSSGVSDDTLASARVRGEDSLREAKYRSFVKQWFKDAPAIGLYQSRMTYAHTTASTAFEPGAHLVTPIDRFGDVSHWTTHQQTVYKTP